MNTPIQIEAAIARTESDIRELQAQANSLPLLQTRLNNTSAQVHLGTATVDDLSAIQGQINKAILARDGIPVKQAALNLLKDQLADAIAHNRRDDCIELAARFDALKAEYARQSDDLLNMFRTMHSMHAQYLGMTGRALLHEVDYMLMLPTTMKPYDSPQHSTGSIVRSAPVRMVA